MTIGSVRVKKGWHRHWVVYKRVHGHEYRVATATTRFLGFVKGLYA